MCRILLKGCPGSARHRWAGPGVAAWALAAALAARGEDVPSEPPAAPPVEPVPAAGEPTPAPAPPQEPQPAPEPARKRPDFEGAIGPMVSINPEYQGASRWSTKAVPGIFIRWGRYTLTNASGFKTRRDDDVMRGFAADLVTSERLRVNLALRIDRGRATKDSAALSGLEDVRSTVRGRLIATRNFERDIGATVGVSTDLLGRGGGTLVDFGLSKSWPLPLGAPWRGTSWSVGLGATAASRRYMRSYFGVTAQQASSTGYPEYAPGAGLRDASAGVSVRGEFGHAWVGYAGFSASRLLGPARDSPLSQRASSWGLNGGMAWRF